MEHQSISENTVDSVNDTTQVNSMLESDWKLRTGLNDETLSAAIEALIFVTDKPLSINKIRDTIDAEIPLKILHLAIEKLQQEYENKHHGIRLQEVALGYQFRTKATYSKILQNYLKITLPTMTPATLEVLAIIAYQQPISKPNIDLMRGVDSSHLVKTLIDKKLINVSGRSETEPGKPSLYITTSDFLEFFNLTSLDDLPKYHELEELAQLDIVRSIPKVSDVLSSSEKQIFDFDDLVEIDDIANKIKDIQVDTEFTKKLKNPTEEIITKNDESGQDVKTTKHLSAFEILESFATSEMKSSEEISSDNSTNSQGLKEIDDSELEALLDAAFDKLTDLEQEQESKLKNEYKVDDDDKQIN